MNYFGHDSYAGDDPKLEKVILKHGMTGYGVYWRCNEFIARNIKTSNISTILDRDLESLEDKLKLKKEVIRKILDFFAEVGLYEKNGEVFSNPKLLHRLNEHYKRSIKKGTHSGEPKAVVSTDVVRIPYVDTTEKLRRPSVNCGAKEMKLNEMKRKEKKSDFLNLASKELKAKN